jgi:putative heme-binding domain-containing protein
VQLLAAVEQGMVQRHELAAADVQRLTTHSDAAIKTQAKRLFDRPVSQRTQAIHALRPSLEMAGEATRGQVIFRQRCASCHRAGSEGFPVGPDLASVTGNGKEKLLASILDPNAEVAAASVAYAVETKDGDSFLGVLAGDNPLAVLLRVPNGESVRIPRENIVSMKASGQSLMPEGLAEGLTAQEMADLLEFIMRAPSAP